MRDGRCLRRRGFTLAGALLGTALLLACGDDDPSAEGTTTTAGESTTTAEATTTTAEAEATTTTQALSDEEQILAAVDGYWQSFLDANDPPDPNYPSLKQYRTGEALEITLDNINERIGLGQAIRLPENSVFGHEATITALDGDRATVSDCLHDDSILYDRVSGVVLNDRVATTLFTFQLAVQDGQWKVADAVTEQDLDGVVPCDAV